METSVVLTAHFAPARPTFAGLHVRTVHPKPRRIVLLEYQGAVLGGERKRLHQEGTDQINAA